MDLGRLPPASEVTILKRAWSAIRTGRIFTIVSLWPLEYFGLCELYVYVFLNGKKLWSCEVVKLIDWKVIHFIWEDIEIYILQNIACMGDLKYNNVSIAAHNPTRQTDRSLICIWYENGIWYAFRSVYGSNSDQKPPYSPIKNFFQHIKLFFFDISAYFDTKIRNFLKLIWYENLIFILVKILLFKVHIRIFWYAFVWRNWYQIDF
jgi:hypothetical protein